jgi:hypothetical protein
VIDADQPPLRPPAMLITPSIPVAADIIHLLNLLARVGWSLRCRTSGGSIDGTGQ